MSRSISVCLWAVVALTAWFPDSASAQGGLNSCGYNARRGLSSLRADGSPRLELVGLTADQRLICFGIEDGSDADNNGPVTGLSGDSGLVGIDYRPASGELWALGDRGGLYVVNARTGASTLRARLSVPLRGSTFGVDFNPTVDRMRIVSDQGQNLRVNVDTGAATVDADLNPTPASVVAAAYTNNDLDANTGTTLYVIDAASDSLLIQAPPNAGGLNATGRLTVDAAASIGFDIYATLRDGASVDAHGFAALTVGGASRFYRINLFTGAALAISAFRVQDRVIDLALPLDQQ